MGIVSGSFAHCFLGPCFLDQAHSVKHSNLRYKNTQVEEGFKAFTFVSTIIFFFQFNYIFFFILINIYQTLYFKNLLLLFFFFIKTPTF
jgi:ABC-type phosphate transport system permease subunit